MRLKLGISVGLVMATACQSSTEPSFADLGVVTIVSSNPAPAGSFIITTTVTNESRHTVPVEISNCPRRFRVETLTGGQVALDSEICALAAIWKSLAPGESHSFSNQWNGKDGNGVQLTGTYRVIGQPFFNGGRQSAPVVVELSR